MAWQQEDAVRTETRLVPYRFSDEELVDLKNELPEILSALHQERDERSIVLKEYNDRIKIKEQNAGRVVRSIRSGVEDRELECSLIPDWATMTMHYYVSGRDEEVWRRPMTAEERQQKLSFMKEHHG